MRCRSIGWLVLSICLCIRTSAGGDAMAAAGTNPPTVAVLPFACADRSNDLGWVGRALPDLITARLGAETNLNVLDRDFIQSVLAEQGLGANGFTASDSLTVGTLRLADFLVLGEVARGADDDVLTLRTIRSAAGTIEKTVVVRGRLPKALDAMADSAAVAVATVVSGTRPAAAPMDTRLARVPEAIDSFYRGLWWCSQMRPLRAAPYFADATKRDPGFILAKVRERQCYAQAGLSRLVTMMDGLLGQVDPAMTGAAHGSNSVLMISLSVPPGADSNMAQEWRVLLETHLSSNRIVLVGREGLGGRTDELDLTLGGKFDARHVPAFRAFAAATHVLGVSLRPGQNRADIDVAAQLQDSFTGRGLKTWRLQVQAKDAPRVAGEVSAAVAAILEKNVADASADPVPGHEPGIGTSWKDPAEVLAAGQAETVLDKAGLYLEMLVQRPGLTAVFKGLGRTGMWNPWFCDAICRTILDRVKPDTYDNACFLYSCSGFVRDFTLAERKFKGSPYSFVGADSCIMPLYESIIALYPDTGLAAGSYFRLGYLQLQQQDFAASAENFRLAELTFRTAASSGQVKAKAEEVDATCANFAYYRGKALECGGQTEAAAACYRETIQTVEARQVAHWQMIPFLWVPDRWDEYIHSKLCPVLGRSLRDALSACESVPVAAEPGPGGERPQNTTPGNVGPGVAGIQAPVPTRREDVFAGRSLLPPRVDSGSHTNKYSKEFCQAILRHAAAIRTSEGVDAEVAYLKGWAAWKEPCDANVTDDIQFFELVYGRAAARLKEAGRMEEAAILYGKLAHVYEKGARPGNWTEKNVNSFAAMTRYSSLFYQAECLEAMNEIDAAVPLYKRLVQECSDEQIQGVGVGWLDRAAIKRLEALRARQEQAVSPPQDGQGEKSRAPH